MIWEPYTRQRWAPLPLLGRGSRRCYGINEYFLAQVWTAGQNVARNPLSSKKAMENASSGVAPQTFTVLALADRR